MPFKVEESLLFISCNSLLTFHFFIEPCSICLRFDDKIHHYKLYYDGTHYIKDKRYDTIYDLVADGLITCHMELKAHQILEMINSKANYTESPYVTLNRRKLNTLSQIQQ